MGLSILALCRTLPSHIRGGMEESSWNLARALVRSGARVTVLTTAVNHQARRWEAEGVTVHELAYVPPRVRNKPMYRWWPHFAHAAAVYARSTALTADIVHSQSLYAAGFLDGLPRPPIVATIHGTARGDYLGGSRAKLVQEVGPWHPRLLAQRAAVALSTRSAKAQLRRIEGIVAVSSVVAGMLPGVAPGGPRVTIIPNGIDPQQFPPIGRGEARERLGLPIDAKVLLFLGRVEEYKGVGLLVDLLPRRPDAWLVIAGAGSYLPTLRARLRVHPAASRVRILGPVKDEERPWIYAAADLLCLPSRSEAQPVSLLEALAMGTPVAIRRPWLPEELLPYAAVHEDPARLVEEGLALAESVNASRAREAVLSRFTWDHVAQRYLDLFRRLAGGRG